jgi:transcription elongation factor Elf1
MRSTKRNRWKVIRKQIRKTKRKTSGGKSYASSTPVSLTYNGMSVICALCRQNNYTENVGTLGKSKMRSGIGSFLFGDAAEVLDTTSIITYFCNNCGLSKTIRNNENIRIVSGPVLVSAPAAAAPASASSAAATAAPGTAS